jgi:Flp pilus assembly protein TadD
VFAGLAVAALPARAETPQELSVLADRATGEQPGIALAQEQAARGEFLEAIATLERVLAANPTSGYAKLLHAVYLCRIDDRMGGAVEIGKLSKKEAAKADLANARTQCGVTGKG